jgi:hypothetical protein
LIGKGFHHVDLLVGKWLNLGLQNGDDAEKNPFAEHRNRQRRTVILLFDQLGKFIGCHLQVPDMNRTSLKCSFPRHCPQPWTQRMSIQVISESRPRAVGRRETEKFAVESENMAPHGSAQTCCALS